MKQSWAITGAAAFIAACTLLQGCGYQLRGSHSAAALTTLAHSTQLNLSNDALTQALAQPLTERLRLLGVHVSNNANNVIEVKNVQIQRFELVGVLTEVRLVMSADVSQYIQKNGEIITVKTPILVERSYQYNKASVSSSDKQSLQTREWLYQDLAERIVEQYYAQSKS